MIEKNFVAQKMKEFRIQTFLSKEIGKNKYSHCEIKKTPLGEKIIIYTSRPGLIVGKKGENIKSLTKTLKEKFKMENPEIEVVEIHRIELNARAMAEQIVSTLERFGPKRFKSIGYKTLQRIMDAGARGVEIIIAGRGVPSSRAKHWRFYAGYLKKCGDIADTQVKKSICVANLKSGSIGVQVKIMTPDIKLPDAVKIKSEKEEVKTGEEPVKEKVEEESVEKTEKKEEEPTKEKEEKEVKKPKKGKVKNKTAPKTKKTKKKATSKKVKKENASTQKK